MNIVSVQYGAKSAVARWFEEYFTDRDRRALPWLAAAIMLAFILAGPSFLLWLASLLPVDQLGNSGASIRVHQVLLAIAGVIALGAGSFVSLQCIRPSMIQLSEVGIRKVWMLLGVLPLKGPWLRWSNIQSVKLLKSSGSTDPNSFVLAFAESKGAGEMKFPLGQIEGEEKRKVLFDSISILAKSVDSEVIEALTPRRALSFTEVWLDALSAPPGREKLLPLDNHTILDTRYKVIRKLGAGGQGTVYLAEDTENGIEVVLKETILPVYADLISRKKALEDFHKEAFALESAQHPNIVKFQRSFVADHRAYLVLDFVSGVTLSETISRNGHFDSLKAKDLAVAMCDILTALHGLSPPLIHRDFTPDNLMISESDKLVLIDFAVSVAGDKTSCDVAGKASYMAPEQFKGKPTPQSDVYSMGCAIYFLLTGSHPEPLEECYPILVNDSVSKSLNDFVAQCTRQDSAQRFQSAAQAKEHLQGLTL